ncbi:MAG: tRNA epoxyqueuosine(34) reductase QueG [Rhizobiaceae bacterium]|nr:tRNA epoxyqueuosine(34) reductase QueG [Rhizobiaceae bacterium]
MASQTSNPLELRISNAAHELGFDICRIASANLTGISRKNLQSYVEQGYHGSMAWIEDTMERRASPAGLWPEAKSVIMLAMNYGPAFDPRNGLKEKNAGVISVYAQNRDYHDLIKGKLKTLAGKLVSWHQCDVKVFVDTAPVMEKPLAQMAGIGWQGKHTNLVSREFGSWLFLGSIFTTATLIADASDDDHCGNCTSCLDICPTKAFPAPYQIDARRCISYLTIENKQPIPLKFRRSIGNRIYGCDDCLAVCPWNKFATKARETKLHARRELMNPELGYLLGLDDAQFRKLFTGSPVKRIGRNRFLRNVLIAAGNSGNQTFIKQIKIHLQDPDPLVRGAAVWALRMLDNENNIAQIRKENLAGETHEDVRIEWSCELNDK